jgi:hypothetical protein
MYGIFFGHLVYFMVIWYIFPCFGMLDQGKSGNPVSHSFDRPSIKRGPEMWKGP